MFVTIIVILSCNLNISTRYNGTFCSPALSIIETISSLGTQWTVSFLWLETMIKKPLFCFQNVYHSDFEQSVKGHKTSVAEDIDTVRVKKAQHDLSQV